MTRDENFHLASRRNFIKILSGMGVSAATLSKLTKGKAKSLIGDVTSEIPVLVGHEHNYPNGYDGPPEIEPVYDTVAYDRWAKIQATHDAANNMERILRENLSKNADSISETEYNNSLSESQVSVGVKYEGSSVHDMDMSVCVNYTTQIDSEGNVSEPGVPLSSVERSVPGTVSGEFAEGKYNQTFEKIPVIVEKETDKKTDVFDSKYRPVVGGCEFGLTDTFGPATIGWSMWHPGLTRRVMLTSGHAIISGSPIEQPAGGSKIGGEPRRGGTMYYEDRGDYDGGYFTVFVNQYPSYAKPGSGYVSGMLKGTRSWDWVKSYGPLDGVMKQGKTTGRTYGLVTKIMDITDQKFKTSCIQKDGDSGAPILDLKSNTVGDGHWVVGHMNWGSPQTNHGKGNCIEETQNRLGIYV